MATTPTTRFCLLAILGIVAAVIAVLALTRHYQVEAQKESAYISFRQLAIGMSNYVRDHDGAFPPASSAVSQPQIAPEKGLSWLVPLLPYMEWQSLYRSIDQAKPWDHPGNTANGARTVPTFLNPA